MSIILRSDKGSALTYGELDGNLEQFYISSSLANDRTLSLFTTGGVEDTITFPAADTLQSVTNLGSTTTNSITALSFIKTGGTSNDILLGDGTVTSLSALGSAIDTGSFYLSSSVSLNTITFTQGDDTTETITVHTGSAAASPIYQLNPTVAADGSVQTAFESTNTTLGDHATIAGGQNNNITAAGIGSFIGAGDTNTISADFCLIGAGISNVASADYAVLAGGRSNGASGTVSSVGGGHRNLASGDYTVLGGGYYNTASANYATVAGGRENLASGDYSTTSGGWANTGSGDYSSIGGGLENAATADYSTTSGGSANTGSGGYSSIGGGKENSATLAYSTIAGGQKNSATGTYTSIGGGFSHLASGTFSTIGGGYDSTAEGGYSTIAGGRLNKVSSTYGAILGGQNNIVASTHTNSSIVAGEDVTTTRADTAFAPSFFASGSTASTGIEGVMQMTRRTAFPTGTDEELAGMLVWKGAASGNHLYFGKLATGTLTWVQLT
tara:strand:+ start:91 stop:1587 length:1497 start_codon:yes stop_codon:yes gene_type:complete